MALPYGVIATIVVVQWLHWYFWQPTARWREDEVGAKISSIVWWSRVKSSQLCAPSPKYVYILPCSWATVLHEQITRRCFTLRQRPSCSSDYEAAASTTLVVAARLSKNTVTFRSSQKMDKELIMKQSPCSSTLASPLYQLSGLLSRMKERTRISGWSWCNRHDSTWFLEVSKERQLLDRGANAYIL